MYGSASRVHTPDTPKSHLDRGSRLLLFLPDCCIALPIAPPLAPAASFHLFPGSPRLLLCYCYSLATCPAPAGPSLRPPAGPVSGRVEAGAVTCLFVFAVAGARCRSSVCERAALRLPPARHGRGRRGPRPPTLGTPPPVAHVRAPLASHHPPSHQRVHPGKYYEDHKPPLSTPPPHPPLTYHSCSNHGTM